MNKIKNGGPAFPHSIMYLDSDNQFEIKQGLSIRDYFAAAALTGYMSSMPNNVEPTEFKSSIARDVYEIADAMLAERERGE